MIKRIHEILLVSSAYDLYIMEEEGLIADRISDEYSLMHLTSAPAITRVSTAEEALEIVNNERFDLVITGLRVGKKTNTFEMARRIKESHPQLPVVLLTSETGRLASLARRPDISNIDKFFFWHGDTRLFLAIIKSLEDMANAPHDCLEEQARVIILVEDSPHFYSTYLPLIYTEIFIQTRELIAEGVGDEEKLMRMRSRPKIMMASSYEEAVKLYNCYRDNVLGIVSDIRFPRNGKLDPNAGFAFTEMVKKDKSDIAVLLQSQDVEKAHRAASLGAGFADKNSPHLLLELRNFIKTHFGFGDFVFYTPAKKEVGRAKNRRDMERVLEHVPEESIEYHARRNHFSNWLFARGEFDLAAKLRPMTVADFSSIEEVRQALIHGLMVTRKARRQASIARYSERDFDFQTPFIRFGEGSIGGKGRGIAFMSKRLADPDIAGRLKKLDISIPQTAAIGTDVFDRFLDRNNLHKIAMEETNEQKIASSFLGSELGTKIVGELTALLRNLSKPLAIRSSSLSEDSLSQPFAGLYSTYMLPNNHPDFNVRLHQFLSAIKLVYASTFFANPKAYMEANNIAIESEKMAVIVQEIVGRKHGNYFYPDMAGVAQSYNFFPVGYLKPEDGVAQLVMGLGTLVARGGMALRFCPRYPGILPQFSKPRDILARSQREVHALDLTNQTPELTADENANIKTLNLGMPENFQDLSQFGGVYSPEDDVIYDGTGRDGQKILTFSRVLDSSLFPLPKILSEVLDIGAIGMGCPVEIEYAASLADKTRPASFAFLQIRPLVSGEEADEVCVDSIDGRTCIASTDRAMGNGIFDNITNLIYVKPDEFDISYTAEIAAEIGQFNSAMVEGHESYILIGFGRWGTANPRLGIPVAYAQVSHAKVICEISTPDLDMEPSQGTHFFHNIASCKIGYLSIDTKDSADSIDWKWLKKQKAAKETKFIKLIKSKAPIVTKIDGRTSRGIILKPTK